MLTDCRSKALTLPHRLRDRSSSNIDDYFSKEEMITIEQWTQRQFSDIEIRDLGGWTNILIYIETYEGNRFGCYISERFHEFRKMYVEDPNAFIYEFREGEMLQYPIRDPKKAIYVSKMFSTPQYTIGDGDIALKPKDDDESMYLCKCKPKSYYYREMRDILLWNKGERPVKTLAFIYI